MKIFVVDDDVKYIVKEIIFDLPILNLEQFERELDELYYYWTYEKDDAYFFARFGFI